MNFLVQLYCSQIWDICCGLVLFETKHYLNAFYVSFVHFIFVHHVQIRLLFLNFVYLIKNLLKHLLKKNLCFYSIQKQLNLGVLQNL